MNHKPKHLFILLTLFPTKINSVSLLQVIVSDPTLYVNKMRHIIINDFINLIFYFKITVNPGIRNSKTNK